MTLSLKWKENWDRTYKITVGTREFEKEKYTIQATGVLSPTFNKQEGDSITVPSKARVMSNIASEGYNKRGFNFNLDSTQALENQGSEGEKTTLELYNLNQDTLDIISQDKCIVIVEAGYQGKVETVYTGDVLNVQSRQNGSDRVYTLTCASGAFSMRNTYASISYDKDMHVKDVITDIVGRFPATALGTAGIEDLTDRVKESGHHVFGKLITEFDNIMAKYNLSYVHLNGKIIITPFRLTGKNYDVFARTNYTLPLNTLKSITDSNSLQEKGSVSTESKKKRLKVNTFYIPVEVGQFITIPREGEAERFAGTYLVKGRRVVLNSRGSAWDVVLDVEGI